MLTVMVSGCRQAVPADASPSDPTTIDGDGGTVVGPDGVTLSVPAGSVVRSAEVAIDRAATLGQPVPSEFELLGEALDVSSSEVLIAPEGGHLELRLPLPPGSAAAGRAVAALAPGDVGTHGGPSWTLLPTGFDASAGELVVRGDGLVEGAIQVAIVTVDGYVPQLGPSSETRLDGQAEDRTVNVNMLQGSAYASSDVRDAKRRAIETLVLDTIDHLVATHRYLEPNMPTATFSDAYAVDVYPDTADRCIESKGKYGFGLFGKYLWICVDPSTDHLTTTERGYAVHELFHAVQGAYYLHIGNVLALKSEANESRNVFGEGTANLAVGSVGRPLVAASQFGGFGVNDGRPLNVPEYADDPKSYSDAPYESQDFWSFLGRTHDLELGFLTEFMEAGIPTYDVVDSVLGTSDALAAFDTIEDAIWAWQRNQAYENSQSLGGGFDAFLDPCTTNNLVGDMRALVSSAGQSWPDPLPFDEFSFWGPVNFQWDSSDASPDSALVTLHVATSEGPAGEGSGIRARFYDPEDPDCRSTPDAFSTTLTLGELKASSPVMVIGHVAGEELVEGVQVSVAVTTTPTEDASLSDNFDDRNYTTDPAWTINEDTDTYPYQGAVTAEDGYAHFTRIGAGGNGGDAGLTLAVDIPVTSATTVQFDVIASYRSVRSGCGDNCTEHPSNVMLTLEDASGTQFRLRYAYNYGGAVARFERADYLQIATDIPQGVWVTGESYTVHDAWPDAVRITQVDIFGNGWDFDGGIDSLVIAP